MKLSIVIPAHNEVESITETIEQLVQVLRKTEIEHEILKY
jgi:glycosyltransferase involved in cell wall biosynthesis